MNKKNVKAAIHVFEDTQYEPVLCEDGTIALYAGDTEGVVFTGTISALTSLAAAIMALVLASTESGVPTTATDTKPTNQTEH